MALTLKEKLGTDDPLEIGRMIRRWVVEYMTSGPVVKAVVAECTP